jgi:hypothetical protein
MVNSQPNTVGEFTPNGVQGTATENQTSAIVQPPPSVCNMSALIASNLPQATQPQSCHAGADPVVSAAPAAPMLPPASEVQA